MWPEALPALAIIAGCLWFTGVSVKAIDRWEYEGKVINALAECF